MILGLEALSVFVFARPRRVVAAVYLRTKGVYLAPARIPIRVREELLVMHTRGVSQSWSARLVLPAGFIAGTGRFPSRVHRISRLTSLLCLSW